MRAIPVSADNKALKIGEEQRTAIAKHEPILDTDVTVYRGVAQAVSADSEQLLINREDLERYSAKIAISNYYAYAPASKQASPIHNTRPHAKFVKGAGIK